MNLDKKNQATVMIDFFARESARGGFVSPKSLMASHDCS
jgi:hypothetical protein